MQGYSADYVFPVSSPPIKNGMVITDDHGEIVEVLPAAAAVAKFSAGLTITSHPGILCPGFVNAHCHLELSHMKGLVMEGLTLPAFIGDMVKKRDADPEIIEAAITAAEDEMIANGIVAAGDICNTAGTVKQKKKNRIRYHNFIELFDLSPAFAEKEFERGISLLREFEAAGCTASLTPHSPYTATPQLLKRIHDYATVHESILTIHNQETASENEMFRSRSGALFEKLSSFGNQYADWKSTGFSSLASTLVHLPRCNKTLLVHNTFTTLEDINWAHLYSPVVYWCFCPNANLYIERQLPAVQTFVDSSCKIVIGTDSYASNHSLSILEELKTISRQFPKIRLNDLLRWSTLNGAELFGWKNELGSFEKGKRPGINLITAINTETLSLTESSAVRPLLIAENPKSNA